MVTAQRPTDHANARPAQAGRGASPAHGGTQPGEGGLVVEAAQHHQRVAPGVPQPAHDQWRPDGRSVASDVTVVETVGDGKTRRVGGEDRRRR